MNIPICEVTIDEDYEKSIPISFSLPPSYVKHIRKIVEDVDIGTDYVADKEDMVLDSLSITLLDFELITKFNFIQLPFRYGFNLFQNIINLKNFLWICLNQ